MVTRTGAIIIVTIITADVGEARRSGETATPLRRGFLLSGSDAGSEAELGEVINDALVRTILFVDLQNARVLVIGGGKNLRRLARKEDSGVSAVAIDEAANDEHRAQLRRRSRL